MPDILIVNYISLDYQFLLTDQTKRYYTIKCCAAHFNHDQDCYPTVSALQHWQ